MLRLLHDLSRSWLRERRLTAAWYYSRGSSFSFLLPRELPVHVLRPGDHRRYSARLLDRVDALLAVSMFSEENPWSRIDFSPTPSTILDLGANNGFSSLYWQMRYPPAKVLGVEMDAFNFARCEALFRDNELTPHFFQCAIAPRNGPVVYHRHEEMGRHRLADLTRNDTQFTWKDEPIEVPGLTFAGFLDQQGIASVDLLKVDIEGAEEFLLRSVSEWAPRVRHMLIEIHHNVDPVQARRALEEAGFQVGAIEEGSRTEWHCVRRGAGAGLDVPDDSDGT
jgi:FkbM family methyltransferase